MQSITYKGGAATLYEFGHKFTVLRRSIVVTDEESINFRNNKDFAIVEISKDEVIPPIDTTPAKTREEARKRLLKITSEQLQEMCVNAKLDSVGTKEVLADRLLDSKE